MTKTSFRGITAIGCHFAIFLPLLAPTLPVANASETTIASGHICSGCPSCESIAIAPPKAIEYGCVDHLHRSGHPETLGRFATPSLNQHYSFGYVGGGAAFRGEPRFADEGTWGVDYSGILFKKQIWLQWLHGQREPRHDGSYHTDRPHLLRH
ncbi:MAG: hypothetical protein O3C40_15440 [Planctomycetota bacterium]|nr:hypothetical protein [Planctomycetota bacterium]